LSTTPIGEIEDSTQPVLGRLQKRRKNMGLVLLLVVLALVLGGVGLAVHALWWLLVIGAVLLIVSAITGFSRRTV
jgi:fatty acid desaturase